MHLLKNDSCLYVSHTFLLPFSKRDKERADRSISQPFLVKPRTCCWPKSNVEEGAEGLLGPLCRWERRVWGLERHLRMTGMTLTIFGQNYLISFSERGKQNEAQKSNFWKFGSVYRFCFPVWRTLMLYFVAELWKISEMDSPSPGLCYNFPCFSWIWIFNLMPKCTLYCLLILTSFAELDQSLQGLLSFERLDRASPDLWPEQSESILFQD